MSKMVNCKTCGQPIAKTAKVCPHCGAKANRHPVLLAFATVFFIFALLFFVGIIIAASSSEPTQKEIDYIEVSAVDLYAAYAENTVNADNQYKDKYLKVTGTVLNIGQDLVTENPCVSLKVGQNMDLYPIQCFFPDSTDEIANLRDGDTVTIAGKCTGYNLAFVQLTDCELS